MIPSMSHVLTHWNSPSDRTGQETTGSSEENRDSETSEDSGQKSW